MKINLTSKSIKVVSFDIFDTLIKRNCKMPSDIFKILARTINYCNSNGLSFPDLRKQSEYRARKNSKREDILINDIYQTNPMVGYVSKEVLYTELEVEEDFLIANRDVRETYDWFKNQGKEIILISDMYLPKSFIDRILKKNGYDGYKDIYVSSEFGLVKSSGKLFKKVIEMNHYNPNEMLHLGDSWRGDWLAPHRIGINTHHIKRYYNHLIYGKYVVNYKNLDSNILWSFINNTISGSRNERIGYETLGPLLYGFCYWLHQERQKRGHEKLLFLARDGYLLQRVYKKMFPDEDVSYVYMSRRSLTVPLIHKQNSLQDILDLIPLNLFTEIKVLLDRLGLEPAKYENIVKKCGLSSDDKLSKDEIIHNAKFLELYNYVQEDIYLNSRTEFDNCKQYLQKVCDKYNIGIVDLGWNGTIQKTLEKSIKIMGLKAKIEGYYMGISLNQPNVHGFIFEPNNTGFRMNLLGFNGMFETLFSANHGSLKRYINDFGLDFYEFEYDRDEKSKKDYQTIMEFQKGALNFVDNILKAGCKKYITWDSQLAFSAMMRLGNHPEIQELKTIGDLNFFDNKIMQLAHPPRFGFFNPKLIKEDFASSTWKIGYLKRLLRFPLPYVWIYSKLRKIANKK